MNVFARCLQADWAERIGWTLLHSLWQIALLAAACTVVSLLLRNRSADFDATRCNNLAMSDFNLYEGRRPLWLSDPSYLSPILCKPCLRCMFTQER